MFFTAEDPEIASYADDNAPYVSADNIDEVIKSLEEVLLKWYSDNLMETNELYLRITYSDKQ